MNRIAYTVGRKIGSVVRRVLIFFEFDIPNVLDHFRHGYRHGIK